MLLLATGLRKAWDHSPDDKVAGCWYLACNGIAKFVTPRLTSVDLPIVVLVEVLTADSCILRGPTCMARS